ncbi:MAG: hypothetical protein Q8865_02885 [Bacillota bacterium]|nr:hypothetical protein [Bacillota bacterium]
MSEKSIQEKIKDNFLNIISKSSKFTAEEVEDIENTIDLPQKADKMAESLLKNIGGIANEDT